MSITDAAAPVFCAGLTWRLQRAETVMYVHIHTTGSLPTGMLNRVGWVVGLLFICTSYLLPACSRVWLCAMRAVGAHKVSGQLERHAANGWCRCAFTLPGCAACLLLQVHQPPGRQALAHAGSVVMRAHAQASCTAPDKAGMDVAWMLHGCLPHGRARRDRRECCGSPVLHERLHT